jgi:hypothetical protein
MLTARGTGEHAEMRVAISARLLDLVLGRKPELGVGSDVVGVILLGERHDSAADAAYEGVDHRAQERPPVLTGGRSQR